MAKKYYAVKEGFDKLRSKEVKDLILESWDECLKYVKGVKGAKYKSFKSREEAEDYLSGAQENIRKDKGGYPADCLHVYVDGSYSIESEKYAYAFVAVRDEVIVHIQYGISKDTSKKQLRQIAGELEASCMAALYACSIGEKKVAIFHDYAGIYHHAVGTWERKDASSKEYYETMNRLMDEKGLEIVFVKTDGHSGDIYNEIADNFAKLPLGIKLNTAVDKHLKEQSITVDSEELWEKLRDIVRLASLANVKIKGHDC
jgi:viroplasmin and RNaseH domain-containing protein